MNHKIAIIEDDPFTKHLYSLVMKRAGYEALIMEDANLLMRKLEEDNIALIIMDINLRNTYLNDLKIDGIQLSKHIKTHAKYSKVPIILVSAFTMMAEKGNILKNSLAHRYITKPITNIDSFINIIKETISN